ncbi:MAG TPA: autotransporter domain-containing protein, partial [Stellaceae bacterium]|nr:autotransporter domain-containing protein [Stellaceae bacterium]
GGGGGGGGGGGNNGNGTGAGSITNTASLAGGAGGAGGKGGTLNVGGGGGGAGGYGAIVTGSGASGDSSTSASITGGNGGAGGQGNSGGNGGDGGVGVYFSSTGASFTISGTTVSGGAGGAGGFGGIPGMASGTGGNGGSGGVGVSLSGGTISNQSGTIAGGNGGAGGQITLGSAGQPGAGGAAVTGANLTISNSGTITGGLGGDGVTQANAIDFTGGSNSLTLLAGSSITGNVVVESGATGSLILGGSSNASFDVSTIGASAQYQGFGAFQKTGSSTWTLTNSTSAVTPWTISAGTLNVSADAALGASSGSITFNGGTLQLGASFNLSSSRAITLAAGGGTIDTNGFSTTMAQAITGSGGLTKAGPGTLTLAAANSYTGGTVIDAGTLQLSGAGTLGSGALLLNGGTLALNGTSQSVGSLSGGGAMSLGSGTLTVNQTTNATYTGAISGSGSVFKTGSGTLILDSVNTYTGGTTVSAGTLEIGDINNPNASVAGDVTVASGGTLAGHGTVEGDLSNTAGGTVSPGGTIGTLTIGGNYTQGSSSTLHIEVSPTAASKLDVSGAASLAGTLALVYDPGVYSKATYDILHAASVSGSFSTVSGTAPSGFTQSVSYTATDVDLALDPGGPVTVAPTNDTIFGALGTAALLNAQQATTTLFGHLADLHSGTGSETIHTALAGTAPDRLAFSGGAEGLNGMLAGLPDAMSRMGGWFRGIGDFASLSGTSAVPGFDTRSGGFLAGIDRPLGEHVIAGAAVGYSHTDIGQGGNSGSLNTPRLMLYASYGAGRWAFDATIGYAYDSISATRPIASLGETASSSHDGQEATGALQATRRFVLDGVSLLPAAGLQYAHLSEGGYSENGASGFDLDVASRNADSLRPFVGVSAATALTTENGAVLIPEADLGYSHEMFNAPPSLVSVGGGSFTVDGLSPSRDELTVGGGVTARMSGRLSLYADYHAVLPTGNLFEQTVSAGLSYRF